MLTTWQEALQNRRQCRGKVVFTNGVFDILHRGHLDILKAASMCGDMLIVGVNSDSSARSLNKAPDRPVNSEQDRAELVAALKPVDIVVIFEQSTPEELVKFLQPDVIVKGGDYSPDDVAGGGFVRSIGGEIVIIPLTPGKSTTELIRKIRKSDCD